MSTLTDLPIWADFPFASHIPEDYVVRRGSLKLKPEDAEATDIFSISHPATGKHVDMEWHQEFYGLLPSIWLTPAIVALEKSIRKAQGNEN